MHGDAALLGEIGEEVGVFSGDGGGRNSGGIACASVWETKVGGAERTSERGDGSESFGVLRALAAIGIGAAVGVERIALRGHALVEFFVEENDAAGNFFTAEGVEFGEIVDDDNFGGEAFGRSGGAVSESGEDDFLRGAGSHAGESGELGVFFAADPMRDHDFLKFYVEAEFFQFTGNILDGLLGLRRAGDARADIFGEVSDLTPGVVAGESGVAEFG